MENQNHQEIHGPRKPFFGVKTFESARSSGYKTTENALAELIDILLMLNLMKSSLPMLKITMKRLRK